MPDAEAARSHDWPLRDAARRDAFNTLIELGGADLRSLLLEVTSARASRIDASEVLRQYTQDRFVAAGASDAVALARMGEVALSTAAPTFEPIVIAPLAPFGACSVMSEVPQNNVVTTCRLSDVVADPTNSLALEAAMRRRDGDNGGPVHLCTVSRVTRAQRFEGLDSYAHFSLFGLLSAGRDRGRFEFEAEAMLAHLRLATTVAHKISGRQIRVRLTAFASGGERAIDEVIEALDEPWLSCEVWPEREHGRGYYDTVGFKIEVLDGDDLWEIGDGGDVSWTRALLSNNKERLVIGGLGLDRLVMLDDRN